MIIPLYKFLILLSNQNFKDTLGLIILKKLYFTRNIGVYHILFSLLYLFFVNNIPVSIFIYCIKIFIKLIYYHFRSFLYSSTITFCFYLSLLLPYHSAVITYFPIYSLYHKIILLYDFPSTNTE